MLVFKIASIDKGAPINAVNQNGCTPLHYAASKNKQEIAIMLLENGLIQMRQIILNLPHYIEQQPKAT